MKRILAMVLCWAMLLSQLVMAAEAVEAAEQSDLLYLEENGIVVEDGGQVIMEDAPLGKSDDAERYSPSIPKFIPETLKNLGLLPREEEVSEVTGSETTDAENSLEIKTLTGRFIADSVELFADVGEDQESILFHGALGMEIEMTPTSSPVWYCVYGDLSGTDGNYRYVRVEDLELLDDPCIRGAYATGGDNLTVQVGEAPEGATVEIETIPAEKAPALRQVRGKNMGERELIYACDITIRNPDGSEWQPEDGSVKISITVPELPELSERGKYYVEHVDHEGNVETLEAMRSVDGNVLTIKSSGFSSFFIYTVDFTVNGEWYSIAGGSSVYLSDLLQKLSVDYTVAEVASVVFSDPELIEVEACENGETGEADWQLHSLGPFYTEELLTLTMKNGEEQVIYVYDATRWKFETGLTSPKYTFLYYLEIGETLSGNFYAEDYTDDDDYTYTDGRNDTALIIGKSASDTGNAYFNGTIEIQDNVRFIVFPYPGNTNSIKLVRSNTSTYTDQPLFKVVKGGLLCIGGRSTDPSKFTITGNTNKTWTNSLVRVEGGRVLMEYVTLTNAITTSRAAAIHAVDNTNELDIQLRYCVINNCDSSGSGAIAIYNQNEDSQLRLYNVTIKNCDGKNGGAIFGANTAKMKAYIWDSTFDANTATGNGGAIHWNCTTYQKLLDISGCTLKNNKADGNGGAIYVNGASGESFSLSRYTGSRNFHIYDGNNEKDYNTTQVTVTSGVTISNNTANRDGTDGGDGGGIYLVSCTLTNNYNTNGTTTITGNTAYRGGGLYMTKSTLTMDATLDIKGNEANGSIGGGVCVANGSTLKGLNEGQYGTLKVTDGNTATTNGGGIAIYPTSSDIAASTFGPFKALTVTGNTAKSNGGGIYNGAGGTISLVGATVQGNTAKSNGGGIYLYNTDSYQGSFTATGALKVEGNHATTNGGGIYYLYKSGATFTMSGTTVIESNTAEGNGGGIFFDGTDYALGSNVSLTGNMAGATSAGAVSSNGGDGGGIYFHGSSNTLTLTGVTMSGNKAFRVSAYGHGGGVYVVETCNLTLSAVDIKDGEAKGNGGGVFLSNGTLKVTGTTSTIQGNTAGGVGGGVYMPTGSITLALTASDTAANDLYLYNNTAARGGGLFLGENGGTVNITVTSDCEGRLYAKGNTATTYGGGVCISGCTVTSAAELMLDGNTAATNGGGLCVKNNGDHATTATLNVAPYIYWNTAKNGGGVFLADGTLNFSAGAYLHDNYATGNGGGIYTSADLTLNKNVYVGMEMDTQQGNCAGYAGGGIYVDAGTLTLIGTEIKNNKAGYARGDSDRADDTENGNGFGGGIYIAGATVVADNDGGTNRALVKGNTAKTNGGGIYMGSSSSVLRWQNTGHWRVHGNSAGSSGGGVYILQGTVSSNSSSQLNVYGNSAEWGGGVYVGGDSSHTINFVFYGSGDEGGLDVFSNTASNSGGGIMAGACTWNVGLKIMLSHNTAARSGGGLYLGVGTASATININKNFNIYGNVATAENGGGIAIASNTTATIASGVTVSVVSGATADSDKTYGTLTAAGNSAVTGGGVYIAGGTVTINGTLTVKSNSASGNGGGVRLAGGTITNNGTMTVGVSGSGNTASVDGGGIHISDDGVLTNNSNLYVKGNTAINGGGVYLLSGTLSNAGTTAQIYSNTATNGGGVYLAGGTVSNTTKMYINTNTATDGGGVYLAGGKLTASGNVEIKQNYAEEGGGVYLNGGTLENTGSAYIYIRMNQGRSTDTNGASLHGGGIHAEKGTISLNGSAHIYVYENFGRYGPGMFFGQSMGTVTINGSGTGILVVRENHDKSNTAGTTGSDGAAVWIEACTVNLERTMQIDRQVYGATEEGVGVDGSQNGNSDGAMRIQDYKSNNGTLNVKSGGKLVIDGCTGKSKGGGISMNGGGVLNVASGGTVTIQSCSTAANGGGIETSGTITNAGTMTLTSNEAVNGGGIYMTGGTLTNSGTVTLTSNTSTLAADTGGGGGMAMTGGTLTNSGTTYFKSNTTARFGGGMYVSAGSIVNNGTMNVGTSGAGNSAAYGGGMYFGKNKNTIPISGSGTLNVAYNTAENNGGGLQVELCTVTVSGSVKVTVNNNTATSGYGGGIVVNMTDATNESALLETTSGEFTVQNNTAKTIGGGIYVDGTFTSDGNLTVSNNTATTNGGGIYADNGNKAGAVVTVSGSGNTISSNTAENNGGGIYVNTNATVSVSDCAISSNTATNYHGGGVFGSSANITLTGCTIDGNTAKNRHGGGIFSYIPSSTVETTVNYTTTLTDCTVSNNQCLNEHGYGINGDTTNTDDDRGAGIYAERINLTISGGSITDNHTVYGRGGGIYYNSSSKTLSVTNCTISGNIAENTNETTAGTAGHGGGIYVNNAGSATLDGCTVNGNTAYANGGGMYLNKGALNFTGGTSTISGNAATSNGGGIYVYSGTVTVNSGATVQVGESNTAGINGGGINVYNGTLSVVGTLEVNSNTAASNGGGIAMDSTGSVQVSGTLKVYSNTATSNGGGIWIGNTSAALTSSGTLEIYGNNAANGGGIYTVASVTVHSATIGKSGYPNAATSNGGGIYLDNGAVFNIQPQKAADGAGTVQYNTATNGAGIYVYNGGIKWTQETISGTAYKGDWSVKNNVASNKGGGLYILQGTVTSQSICELKVYSNTAAYGGGLYLGGRINDSDSEMKTVTFTYDSTLITPPAGLDIVNNTATRNGGGIMAERSNWTTDLKLIISHNYATNANSTGDGKGGGIFLGGWSLGQTCTINGEVNIYGCTAAVAGGGIYIADNKTTMTVSTSGELNVVSGKTPDSGFNSLTAAGSSAPNGGGIYMAAGTLTNNGTLTVEGNAATSGNGGGIYLTANAVFTAGTLTVNENTATVYGGGIYVTGNTLTLKSATVNENKAGSHGGGIYATSTTTTIEGGTISNNIAGNSGGGLFGTGSTLTLSSITFDANEAGASAAGTASTTGGSGGGIYATNCGQTLTLTSVTLSNNTAHRVNNSGGHGGGICVTEYNLTFTGTSKIQNNTAQGSGGGIYISNSSTDALKTLSIGEATEISGNAATGGNGGGAFVQNCDVTMGAGTKILSNKASSHGGGIFVYRSPNTTEKTYLVPTVTMTGTTSAGIKLQKNTATKQGGGAYVRGCHLIADCVDISENTSGAMGGGLLIFAYAKANNVTNLTLADMECTFTNGNISDNTSGSNAGGAYVEGYGKLTIDNTTIQRNTTAGDGGGLLLSMQNFSPTITDCTISYNTASLRTDTNSGTTYGSGGGIRMFNMAVAPTLTGTTITYNVAYKNGGGISIANAPLKLDNSVTVSRNDAGATGTRAVSASTTGGNGGGIYFATSGKTLTMEGATVGYNGAYGNGGGIYMESGTILCVTGAASSKICYNTATGNGGGLYMSAGSIKLEMTEDDSNAWDLHINNNSATNGGGAYFGESGSLTIATTSGYEGRFYAYSNTASADGGGLYTNIAMTLPGNVQVGKNSVTTGNSAVNGGGIYVNGVALTLNGATVQNNTASQNGGGIYVNNGSLVSAGTSIGNVTGNCAGAVRDSAGAASASTTGGNGGGIYLAGTAIMAMSGGTLSGNGAYGASDTTVKSCGFGGGIYVDSSARATLSGGAVSENYVLVDSSRSQTALGGGIYTKGTVTFTGDFEISGNTTNRYGGGFFLAAGTTTVNSGATVDICTNEASHGGGVSISSGTLAVTGTLNVTENTASVHGGGICMDGTGTVNGSGTIAITSNTATTNGGGVYMLNYDNTSGKNQFVPTGKVTIASNAAGTNGGGIYINANSNSTAERIVTISHAESSISQNTAGTNGGGIYMAAGTVTLTSATVNGNYAVNGGGIYMTAGTVTLTSATVNGNYAVEGGGIYMTGGTANLTGGTTVTNHSKRLSTDTETTMLNGGGIRMTGGKAVLDGAYITNNAVIRPTGTTSGGNGGGICASTSASLEISGSSVISGNSASFGGGINTSRPITITDSTITGNTAKGSGGGIFVSGSTTTLNGTAVIQSNTAPAGGGVRMTGGALTLTSGTAVKGNTATTGEGGGISIGGGTLNLQSNSSISGNTATDGGGVYYKGGTITLPASGADSVQISSNTASTNGGGIYVEAALTLDGSLMISENTAGKWGGGICSKGANITLTGCTIDRNTATNGHGGGIFSYLANENTDYTTTLTDCTVSNNQCKNANGNGTNGNTNSDDDRGAGIYAERINLIISGGSITGNRTVYGRGGGIFYRSTSKMLSVTNCTISGNIAENTNETTAGKAGHGGGIYVNDAGSATITGGNISGNRAYGNGGGISIVGTATLTVAPDGKSPIRDNMADVAGNDVYAAGATTAFIIPATEDNGVAEYWFADYAENDANYPGQPVFPSDYMVNGKYAHLGRYEKGVTPVTFARRSFGGTSTETGAADASTAYLALTLGTAEDLFMDLTLSKTLSEANGAVENTTFIFYIKGVDDADYLLPVMIHLNEGEKNGEIVLKNLPVGIYDIFEDESWSWRYTPSSAVSSADSTATLITPEQGDHYARVQVTLSDGSHKVTFGNGLERKLWLTDAEYLPFLVPATATTSTEDEEETE